MYARLSAFVIWSIVAATAVFWALRLAVSGTPIPPTAQAVDRAAPLKGDLARLFGSTPVLVAAAEAPAEAPSRFKLVGVMAPKGAAQGEGRYGLALIAVDGKPARAYAVGARLDDATVLQAVSLRTAALGNAGGGRTVLLELPALPAPATGTLPPPGAAPLAAPAIPMPLPAFGAAAGVNRGAQAVPAPQGLSMQPQAVPPPPTLPPMTAQPPGVAPQGNPASADNFRAQ